MRGTPRHFATALVPAGLTRWRRGRDWEKKWAGTARFGWQVEEVAQELAHAVDAGWLTADMSVFDIGCGAGENAAWLARRGFQVLAVDISAEAITRAKHHHRELPNLRFSVLDVTRPGVFDRQFDAVIDRGCLHGIPPELRTSYAENVKRWVRPSGTLLLTMHTGAGQGIEVRRAQVSRMLSPPFTIRDTVENVAIGTLGGQPIKGLAFHLTRR